MTVAVAGAGRCLSGHPSHYRTTVCAAEVHPAPPPLTCLLARCLLGGMDEDGAMPYLMGEKNDHSRGLSFRLFLLPPASFTKAGCDPSTVPNSLICQFFYFVSKNLKKNFIYIFNTVYLYGCEGSLVAAYGI